MSRARDEVILEYSHLNDGDTSSGEMCPACKGGTSRESSMSVGRTNGWLWWRCHRASCDFKGSYRHGRLGPKQPAADPKLNRLTFTTESLPNDVVEMLRSKYTITDGLLSRARWEWTDAYGGRVVMPILDMNENVIGHSLRSYDPSNEPKAMINRTRDVEQMCWYFNNKYPGTLVIVEDQPSALRISGVRGMCGLALMGTHINYDRCMLIKRSKINRLVLSLDEDATSTAVQHMINFRSLLPGLRLVKLNKDIKDMSPDELDGFILKAKES